MDLSCSPNDKEQKLLEPRLLQRIPIAWRSCRREAQNGLAYAAAWFLRRFYLRYVRTMVGRLPVGDDSGAARPLSLIVPAVEKDALPLVDCLAAANAMIRHPLTAKLVAGPESPRLRTIAGAAGWTFVAEDEFLPRPAAELRCRGWILQQFIKFYAAGRLPTEDYLVLDADTVFLRPQIFFRGERAVLRYSDQYELLYNRSLELILGHRRRFPVSFVTHHMVFNTKIVHQILSLIERRFQCPWWQAILEEVDKDHLVSFSEFELYGNYAVSQAGWRRRFVLEYWAGADRQADEVGQCPAICKDLAGKLNSVSFHSHTQ